MSECTACAAVQVGLQQVHMQKNAVAEYSVPSVAAGASIWEGSLPPTSRTPTQYGSLLYIQSKGALTTLAIPQVQLAKQPPKNDGAKLYAAT